MLDSANKVYTCAVFWSALGIEFAKHQLDHQVALTGRFGARRRNHPAIHEQPVVKQESSHSMYLTSAGARGLAAGTQCQLQI